MLPFCALYNIRWTSSLIVIEIDDIITPSNIDDGSIVRCILAYYLSKIPSTHFFTPKYKEVHVLVQLLILLVKTFYQ